MPRFQISSNGSVPQPYNTWRPSTKFNSRGKVVASASGTKYILFEKKERNYSVRERKIRIILGIIAVAATLFIGLAFKRVRKLFTAKVQTERFGRPFTGNPSTGSVHVTPGNQTGINTSPAQTNTATVIDPDFQTGQLAPSNTELSTYWRNSDQYFTVSHGGYLGSTYTIITSRYLVDCSPEETLQMFHSNCFKNSPTTSSLRIELLEDDLAKDHWGNYKKSPAVDAGGVTREMISVLFSSISKEALENKDRLHFQGGAGGSLPIAKTEPMIIDEKVLYEAMGKIMGMCFTTNEAVIGNIFKPELYDVLKIILTKNLENKNNSNDIIIELYQVLKALEKDDLLSFLKVNKNNNDAVIQHLFDNAYIMEDEIPAELQNDKSIANIRKHLDLVKDSIKTQVLENAKLAITPILEIAKGMRAHSPHQDWGTSKNIQDNIQGIFNKQSVKNALKGNQDIIAWMNKWINESSDEDVQKFLRAATGSDTLGVGKHLTVTKFLYRNGHIGNNMTPKYHTCSSQVDFSDYSNYAKFKEKLDESILNALCGFGMI